MTGGTPARRRPAAWEVFGLAGAAAVLAYVLAPPGPVAEVLYYAVSAAPLGAALLVLLRRPAVDPRPVRLLVAALLAFNAGNLVWVVAVFVLGHPGGSPVATLLSVLGFFLLLGVSAVQVSTRLRGDTAPALDAAIGAVAGGALLWELVVLPLLVGAPMSVARQLLVLGTLLPGVAVLGALVHVGRGRWRTCPAVPLLAAASVAVQAGSLLLGVRPLGPDGQLVAPSLPGLVLLLLAYVLVGTGVLHPSFAAVGEPADDVQPRRTPLWLLGAALLVAPGVVLVRLAAGRPGGVAVLAVATLLLVPLVLRRIRLLTDARDSAEGALRAGEERLRAMLAHAGDGVLLLETGGSAPPRVAYVSPAAAALCPALHAGQPLDLARDVHPDDLPALQLALDGETAGPGEVLRLELRVAAGDGYRWVEAAFADQRRHPAIGGHVVNLRDVSERKAREAESEYRSRHDPLTGLANRRQAQEHLDAALASGAGSGGARAAGLAVLFGDLDGFKPVNDRLGHAAGDRLLVAVAERLRAETREGDLVARLGGDEFLVVADGRDGPAAEALAERLRAAVAEPVVLDGEAVQVSISFGVSCTGGTAVTGAALLAAADRAMYADKRGRSAPGAAA